MFIDRSDTAEPLELAEQPSPPLDDVQNLSKQGPIK